jgi:hypothetical protein
VGAEDDWKKMILFLGRIYSNLVEVGWYEDEIFCHICRRRGYGGQGDAETRGLRFWFLFLTGIWWD